MFVYTHICVYTMCAYTHACARIQTLYGIVGVRLRKTLPTDWGYDHILCGGETVAVSRDASVKGGILEVSQVEACHGVRVSGKTRAGHDKSEDVGEVHLRRLSSEQEVLHALFEKGRNDNEKIVKVQQTARYVHNSSEVQKKEDRILLHFGGQSGQKTFGNRRQYH